jgi:hypothetical protein
MRSLIMWRCTVILSYFRDDLMRIHVVNSQAHADALIMYPEHMLAQPQDLQPAQQVLQIGQFAGHSATS